MKQENSEIGKKVLTDGLDHCRLPLYTKTLTNIQYNFDSKYLKNKSLPHDSLKTVFDGVNQFGNFFMA